MVFTREKALVFVKKKGGGGVREKSRECHNHKPQPFPDTKRKKRKPTKPNKHKSNKRTKSTKISSLFPKQGNRNAKRTEKHKNKITLDRAVDGTPSQIPTLLAEIALVPHSIVLSNQV